MYDTTSRELDIRKALRRTEIPRLCASDPYCLVVDELGILQGKYRIDLAIIGQELHGYEIKSATDNLSRLPNQQSSYNKVFDRITLVADERHVAQAVKIVQPWWGLISASTYDGQVHLDTIWPARQNPHIDPAALCQLLWRDEALKILKEKGLSAGMWSRRRRSLWTKLRRNVGLEELKLLVRKTLHERSEWRVREAVIPTADIDD
jgi:hypothetical protein